MGLDSWWICISAFSLVGQHFLVLQRGLLRSSLHRAEPNQRLCLALSCGLPLLGDCSHHLDHHLPDLPAPLGCSWGLPLLHHSPGHSLTTSRAVLSPRMGFSVLSFLSDPEDICFPFPICSNKGP
ncbi:presenilin enhancer 2 homolog (C. elegans), isoform CRA_b [Rattus norvegicus]|uniref:Presenilin enhancer 2 homolog (C. elegans), isoform CRA_b n=1 Tax=Rattus norvegicus TaxID=10116 RepID=A6J9Y9_RAT|nr:presenilin enhancer 2 homolog (C. elegans), isoform CRA_b [Rattus norvegicus]